MKILLKRKNLNDRRCNEELEFSQFGKVTIKTSVSNRRILGLVPDAGLPLICMTITLALYLIKLGAEINAGIDGWIELGKKILNLFIQDELVSVDSDGATALAINHISKYEDISCLKKMTESMIDLPAYIERSHDGGKSSDEKQMYYIQTYTINNQDVYVVGVTSNGKTEIIKHFKLANN